MMWPIIFVGAMTLLGYPICWSLAYERGRAKGETGAYQALRGDGITIGGGDPLVGPDCPLWVQGPHYKVSRVGFPPTQGGSDG